LLDQLTSVRKVVRFDPYAFGQIRSAPTHFFDETLEVRTLVCAPDAEQHASPAATQNRTNFLAPVAQVDARRHQAHARRSEVRH
jgi:hypothetical protein